MTARTDDARIRATWDANATAWTDAVRGGRIESRRVATDAAIVAACERQPHGPLLDVGCGEGWLLAALADRGRRDRYDALVDDASRCAGPWRTIVCNFALLDADLVPVLRALRARLAPDGALLVQTVHPWAALGDARYASAWREERWQAFGDAFAEPMPWYYRTLGDWVRALGDAGFGIARLEEPVHPDTGRPLSLLLQCRSA
ncbi:MAG: class I SAM-dependent methyltransferase [Gemmatimonadaceae bacterium]|nr:class I SAM-dependent methyltransferase [Gemmatimonadaceae bacterium]